ncbi:MAG TPA: iron ABC transporter permease [Chloroflexota bacterium]|nr:iron ABC transporter permease [Chloroflexota bacterium]
MANTDRPIAVRVRPAGLAEAPRAGFQGLRVEQIILGVAAALLLILVGYPLLWLLLGSLGVPQRLDLTTFQQVARDPSFRQPLVNTVILAIGTAILSTVFGVPLAWFAARTDVPLKRFLRISVAVAYIVPPYLTALAYIILAGPNAGILNRLFVSVTGAAQGPINVFSLIGVMFVIALHSFAIVFFFTYSALLSIDASQEEAARILGASRLQTTIRVTLPLVMPSITAGALLAGVTSMALFGPQAFIGMPGRVFFLPTRIYALFGRYPPAIAEASALAFALIVLTVIGLGIQRWYLAKKSYVTVSGKSNRAAPMELGPWKWVGLSFCLVVICLAVIFPVLVLVNASISKSWVAPFSLDNLTTSNFHYALFEEPMTQRGIVNSLKLAAGAATLAMVIGAFIAYLNRRTAVRGRQALDYLSILPLGLPGIVLAVGLLQAWIRPPLVLYGTIWILLVTYIVRFIPLAVRSADASIQQVDPSLEDAARISGASWMQTVRLITARLIQPGLLVGWILVFIPAIGELSATILLYSAGNETMAVALYRLRELGRLELVASIAVMKIVMTLAALYVAQRIAGKELDELASGGRSGGG